MRGNNSANAAEHESQGKTKKTIVFFGDSLTAGLGLASQDDAWPALVGEKLNSEGYDYDIINAGLSGDTTSGGLSRLDWALRIKPDVFVLELGANDSMRGVPIATIRKNLNEIIQTVQSKSPETKILLAGMRTFPNLGAVYRKQFDNLYPEIAREHSLLLVPFILDGIAGDRKLNQKDGIHPTEDGHKIMAENIYPYIKKLL
ncbi:arylesterase [Leptospira sp. GIMC2001]|uniref:arylesterase n=1 Tax=Leptospira sp. GIMC2001 TaxID=1513297 RepID=UPI003FA56EB5